MKVVVDKDLCEGNGRCQEAAPEVFRVNDEDQADVLVERPAEGLREKVELAVRRCPRAAIRLEQD